MTSKLSRYALAIAAVLVAVGVRILLAPLLTTHAPLLLLTLSVMVAARFGGVGPGLLATGLSLVIGTYFFIAPYYSFRIANPADAVYLLLFLVVGVAISLLNGQLRRAFELSEEAAQRYHTLSEAVPQLVWTSAPDGSFDHLNARWAQFTGVPAARQLGFAWVEQIHPDDRAALLQRWTAAVNGSAEFRMEFRIRRQDGVHRWFDGRAAALRDAAGVVLKWFGSATDIHEAHEAREALRLEEERLKKIAETAPGVICSYRQRPDGTACFPYASPRIQDIYGRRPEDLAEDAGPIFKLMHPEDAGHVQATIAQSARTMMPWRDEFRVRNPERGEIWVEGHAQPARLADGSVEWYGFVADITARHQMEQALRNRTARLEELTRTLDLAHVIVRTLDGRITYWSQGAAAMYGWSFDEADGQPVRELLKTEFPAPWKEIESTLLAEGRWEGEMRQYRRDGTPVVVASYWALHRDHTGAPVSIIEVNNDISEQKRVEGELRDSELRLELAQAAAGIGVWDWNLCTNETLCSDSYGPLYGLPRSHRAPSSEEWLAMIHPADRERMRKELRRVLEESVPYDTEFRIVCPDGSVRWLMGQGQVYRDSAGNPVRMVGVNMDITHRKTSAEQLRALSASLVSAQEEERRRISRELHDDLTQRLCLMAIDLGKLASRPPFEPDVLTDELRFLQERAVQAAELTRHIAHELHPSILDDLGIESALRSYCEEFARREEIEAEFSASDLPQGIKRETASCLYAIVQEGLLNVSKHARAARVRVELSGRAGSVRLSVSDDGIGFSPESRAAFGLGIVNMRERVRWMNGSFSVLSQPGYGTRITAEVPV